MGTYIKPCYGRALQINLAGTDITQYVHCIRAYETLCKPYLTAHLIIMDNNNLIDSLNIKGGEACGITFDSPPNDQTTYEELYFVLQMTGHQAPTNIKTQIYDLDLIGMPYFRDKGNIVQEYSSQEKITDEIKKVWDKYCDDGKGIEIPIPSNNMTSADEKDPMQIHHKKPFAAIDDLRKYCIFSDYSPSLLFRDAKKTWLWPFTNLVKTGTAGGGYFVQKETWGARAFDPDIYRTVIFAEADVDRSFNGEGMGGRAGTMNVAKSASQGKGVFDIWKGVVTHIIGSKGFGSGLGAGIAAAGSMLGGSPNIMMNNSNKNPDGNSPPDKSEQEQATAAEAKNGPQLKLKVPLQTGIDVTVGNLITCSLIGPVGPNFSTYQQNPMSGTWCVKDICHELYTDKREVNATTVMQLIRDPDIGGGPGGD
jgi:hypothetical protein